MFIFLFALWCFELCLVSLLCCSHCIMFVLDIHTSLCYCASLIAYSNDHLLCYVIIVVISLWLFWCMVKLLIYFTPCLLDRDLLVTLYLSFYYLLYLEGLICFVQVFQVTSIYVPSASHHSLCIYQGWEDFDYKKTLFCLFFFLYPCFCSLVIVVNVMHLFKYITLVPLLDFIFLMQLPCVVVLVECWTCKWYFALSLLAYMFGCSFLAWIFIVITIYNDCSCLVKPYFTALILYCLITLCLLYMHFKISAYNDHLVLFF